MIFSLHISSESSINLESMKTGSLRMNTPRLKNYETEIE
jgi:hypothetical protein